MSDDEFAPQPYVFVGYVGRAKQGKKPLVGLIPLTEDHKIVNIDDVWLFEQRSAARAGIYQIGGVYAISTKDKVVRFSFKDVTFLHRWPDVEQAMRWSAEEKTLERADKARDMEKKEQKFDYLKRQLAPVQRAYQATNFGQRAQFVALVIHLITRDEDL